MMGNSDSASFGVAFASPPSAFHLGGLFSQFNGTQPDSAALQYQAAFLLAVKHINDKADGIFDDILPDSEIKIAVRHADSKGDVFSAVSSLFDATIDGSRVSAVINGLESDVSALEYEAAEYEDVFMMRAASDVPFQLRSNSLSMFPGVVYEAVAMQMVLCGNNYSRVSVIMDGAHESVMAFNVLKAALVCPIQIVSSTIVADETMEELMNQLSALRYARVNIFMLLIADPLITGKTIYAAKQMGLFRVGKQVFLSQYSADAGEWDEVFPPGTSVPDMLGGSVSQRYLPNFKLLTTPAGVLFAEQWGAQNDTIGDGGSCLADADDSSGAVYLHSSADGSVCAGLNYSQFTSATSIARYVTLVYDAVVTYAVGMHYATVELGGAAPATTAEHKAVIMAGVDWYGLNSISGRVSFNAGGTRDSGASYAVANFNPTAYAQNPLNPFATFYTLEMDTFEFGFCSPLIIDGCVLPPVFNTHNKEIPVNTQPFSSEPIPDVIRIAIFIKLFDGDVPDIEAIQYLSAIVLAVNEINNKTDGISDHVLPNSRVVLTLQQPSGFNGEELSVAASMFEAFGGKGVVGSISALGSEETIKINQKFEIFKRPTVSFRASASELGSGDDFPYKVALGAADTFQGMVLQEMLCNYFKYDKFTVIAGQDFFGSKGAIEISDDTYCGIKPMSVHLATTDGDNINEIVNEAKVFGARIFAILVGSGYEKTAARLIEEGAAKGLFGMDTQIFLPHQLIDGQFWKFFSNDADVPLLMKGLISLRYDPLDMVRRSETGMQFIERWRAQQSSQWEVDGSTECLQTRDDDDQYYLYRSEGDTAFTGYTCAGLNYSNFLSDASNVAPYIGHAYDSANVLLLGIDAAITQYGNNFTGDDLMQAIFDIAEFDGATGVVDVFEGMKQFSGYGQGNREVGQIFYALNFDKSMYVMNGPDGDFMVPVLLWTAEAGAELIHAITFHSSDGQMVPDRLPSTVREDNFESKRIILVVMACLCFFSSGFYILMYALNWKSKYVTSSQPRMSLLILLGGILVGGRVLNAAMRITDATCIAGLWLGHLGFCLVFCALFIKMWRVSALINAGLKKIRISEWFVVQLTLAAFACMAVYMCILTWVGLPHASHQCTTEHNEMTCLMQCSFKHAEVHTALFFIEGAMVLYGAYLCYRIKGAPAAVNDSKYNAQAILAMAIIGTVGFIIVFLVELNPSIRQLVASVGIAVGFILSCFILFNHILVKIMGFTPTVKKKDNGVSGAASSAAYSSANVASSNNKVDDSSAQHCSSVDEESSGRKSTSSMSSMNLSSILGAMFIKKKSNKQIHGEVATANVSPPRGVFPKVEEDRAAVEKCADAASEQENLKLAEV